MTDKLVEQIKADRKAGTQGKFCKTLDHNWFLDTGGENAYFVIKGDHGPFAVVAVEEAFGMDDHNEADMRRVCNIPDMESRILADAEVIEAADRMAAWVKAITERGVSPKTGGRLILERDVVGLETALAAYNEKRGERE